jgi:hypothetical protein
MELDIQRLFGLHPCAQLYSFAETQQPPSPPPIGLLYEGAIDLWSAKIDDISL